MGFGDVEDRIWSCAWCTFKTTSPEAQAQHLRVCAAKAKDTPWQVPVVTQVTYCPATRLSKKVYVAAKFTEKDRVRALYTALKEAGHTITFDWTTGEVVGNELEAFRAAQNDLAGVHDADVVVLLPHAYSRGAYVELGYALALNKKIIVVGGPEYRDLSVFLHASGTHWVKHDGAVVTSITALWGSRVEK